MATKILIPTPLRPYTDKHEAVEASGATIGELLVDLTTRRTRPRCRRTTRSASSPRSQAASKREKPSRQEGEEGHVPSCLAPFCGFQGLSWQLKRTNFLS